MESNASSARLPPIAPSSPSAALGVLPALTRQAKAANLDALDRHLLALQALLHEQLADVETQLLATRGPTLAQRAGQHLLAAGGKRLRPLCTLLASRLGDPTDEALQHRHARDLAVAVELVHAATLLHDDVVDLADTRRNQPTARVLHGNAISVFAGDWLLVEALRRICVTGIDGLVPLALATIEQMIFAEVEQSQRAKSLARDRAGYFRVIDGKTAALFRWAMRAGARAGHCDAATEEALVAYGGALGLAFQLTDDALDFDGDAQKTGKPPLADLAEGKVTLPLILLLEAHPEYLSDIETLHAAGLDAGTRAANAWQDAQQRVLAGLQTSGAIVEARRVAAQYAADAAHALRDLPEDADDPHAPERAALLAVAETLAQRTS
jgi:octaprenyl-diphosphate synthase